MSNRSIKTRTKYCLTGADYSAQEPRSLAAFSKDKDMIEAYNQGKDLYAVIASKCFHNNYEDNLEFIIQQDGTKVKSQEGASRRSKAKMVLLGILYGMGPSTLAERLGLSLEESSKIINLFYENFEGVNKFTKESQKMARELGYVTDIFGRRRHLDDALLEQYEVIYKEGTEKFNPFIGVENRVDKNTLSKIELYKRRLKNSRYRAEIEKIKKEAEKEGFSIKNNGGFISRALRQTLNARIQGTAASMTKLAMIKLDNDEELKNLGFRLLVTVHDEVFGECPIVNAEKVSKRVSALMIEAAKVKCGIVPWKCDGYIVSRWYLDELASKICDDYNDLINKDGFSKEEALQQIKENYSHIKEHVVESFIKENYNFIENNEI